MEFDIVGKRTPLLDGLEKVTGRARYVTDIRMEGMLHGKILRSPHPHARIVKIDTSRAEKISGVRGIITGFNVSQRKFGTMLPDWVILPDDKVRFVGDEVAAVAATSEAAAIEALDLIEVEYEPLPAVFDQEEAMSSDAPLLYEDKDNNIATTFQVERGDVDGAFAESDIVFEDDYETSQVYQAHLEPMAGLAAPADYDRLTLWLSTQVPSMSRLRYAEALGICAEDLRIIKPHVGGGFGAKFEYKSHILAAVLARRTGLPVRMVNTRDEDFIAGNPRVPMKIRVKLGLKMDGTILAKDVRIVAGNGARTVYGPAITSTACYRIDSLYKIKNVRSVGYTVYTNMIPTSCFRGFGNAQMHFAMEQALDAISHENGLDPVEVRRINGVYPGYVSVHGWEIKSCALQECVDRAVEASEWYEKKKNLDKSGIKKRGIGLALCNHVSGNRPFYRPFDGSSALVRLTPEGKAIVFTGEADLGQGLNTTFAIIAAEALGLPIKDVRTAAVDTDISPFGLGSFATRATTIGGRAVYEAAVNLKEQLLKHVSKVFDEKPENIMVKKGKVTLEVKGETLPIFDVMQKVSHSLGGASLVGQGTYVPDTVLPDEGKYGNVSPAYPFACHIAEVEVDTETGSVKIINYWAAHDVGRVLNEQALEGQVEGGVVMGAGWALMEEMIVKEGHLVNPKLHDYWLPTSMDIPVGSIHSIFLESVDPNGPFGAKGIGEPALNPVAAAIANAIFDATGARIKKLPISPDKILGTLINKEL